MASVHARLVSVYSTAPPQGLASPPSVSWRVRRPLWLWPRLEDFHVCCSAALLQLPGRTALGTLTSTDHSPVPTAQMVVAFKRG